MEKTKRCILECCVDSAESALFAKKGGADRLELCSGLVIGGLTPTLALYRQIRETVDIRIHVLIRPRFGDFLYSPQEMNVMEKEIEMFRQAGADGIVIGCLSPDGTLAVDRMKRLMEQAQGMSVTLHRAFDMCRDPFCAMEQAISLGVHTILTSGQQSSCLKGIDLLIQLQRQSGGRIDMMAGAGINETAVRTLLQQTDLTSFHMSGKKILPSGMEYRNPNVSMGIPGMNEYEIWRTDPEELLAVRMLLDTFVS